MTRNFLLEIAVKSVEAACAAEREGAGRIELCTDLEVGGVTPREETMKEVRRPCVFPFLRSSGHAVVILFIAAKNWISKKRATRGWMEWCWES